jgi:hypothetical protein
MTLYPKKSSAVCLLLICSVFVAGGIWAARSGNWIGYLVASFFGLCLPVALIQLLPGSSYLAIDDTGITVCNLFRKTSIPWSVIGEFHAVTLTHHGLRVHKMVAFNFMPSYDGARLGRRLARLIGGCEGALPDTYGKSAEELAEFLNSCLREFMGAGPRAF